MTRGLSWLVLLATIAGATAARAADSRSSLTVQGVLRDHAGALQSLPVDVVVRLYAGSDARTPFFTQTFTTVAVDNGLFGVELSGMGLSFDAADVWVGLQVADDAAELPRQHVTAVPFALSANDARALGGVAAANWRPQAAIRHIANQPFLATDAVLANSNVTIAPGGTGFFVVTVSGYLHVDVAAARQYAGIFIQDMTSGARSSPGDGTGNANFLTPSGTGPFEAPSSLTWIEPNTGTAPHIFQIAMLNTAPGNFRGDLNIVWHPGDIQQ